MNLIVCDFDGVLTRLYDEDGNKDYSSYLNYDSSTYGPSEELVDRLKSICHLTNAKVLISSNWRRYDDDQTWEFAGQHYPNQLPLLKHMLGSLFYDELPKDRHNNKSQALELWFEMNDFTGEYVIFDDDEREGFQNNPKFRKHYIQTDSRYGITLDDYEQAIQILKCD